MFRNIQIVITTNFVVVSSVGIKKVDCSIMIIKCGIYLSFLNWIEHEVIFYCISELMLATLIQRYDKKSFQTGAIIIRKILIKEHCVST